MEAKNQIIIDLAYEDILKAIREYIKTNAEIEVSISNIQLENISAHIELDLD